MKKSIKFRLIIGSLVLFTCALGINVILNSSSVDKLCEDSTIARYRLAGDSLQRTLSELTVSQPDYFGSYEIQKLLNRTKLQLLTINTNGEEDSGSSKPIIDHLTSVSVMLPDRTIAASTNINVLAEELATNERTLSIFLGKAATIVCTFSIFRFGAATILRMR